ncbi:Auxin-responsive protein IAA26 [Raphanus sativus]|uniref:Auxin-responsive protein n=1 Tax=Raphanus sativus TaxID=3726 RepID=A0A6J0NP80_RAPSA|nr:auxin-responsive protein IAA26 [Raphanus sativus]KAJ4897923.1 Auxin-responsive protein IAA26 [Raphanus sativus]
MESCPRNRETCPKLLDLIPRGRKWHQEEKNNTDHEHKLELRLAPPGGDEEDHYAVNKKNIETRNNNIVKEAEDKPIFNGGNHSSASNKTIYTPHISHKRTAPGPVVGWPPVRSFRKNLASTSSSKLGNESSLGGQVNKNSDGEKQVQPKREGMFVKINMDSVLIGRKIDLNAYNSYKQLSFAVDKLFRGLLAAQRENSGGEGEEKPIINSLDGKGEFTLTYEDNEGDKMLVGDVPWHMFISSVKRLRVIKSSEISSALRFGCSKQQKLRT